MQGPHALTGHCRPLSLSVVLFLLSESIDGGIKGKKDALTWAFRAEREGERERGQLEILEPYC